MQNCIPKTDACGSARLIQLAVDATGTRALPFILASLMPSAVAGGTPSGAMSHAIFLRAHQSASCNAPMPATTILFHATS